MSGWIKLHRKIEQNEAYVKSCAVQRCMLLSIFMRVQYKPIKIKSFGQEVQLYAGDIITSTAELIEMTGKGATRQKIRTALDRFEKSGIISVQKNKWGTLISLVNWDKYQAQETENNATNLLTNLPTNNAEKSTNLLTTEVTNVKSNATDCKLDACSDNKKPINQPINQPSNQQIEKTNQPPNQPPNPTRYKEDSKKNKEEEVLKNLSSNLPVLKNGNLFEKNGKEEKSKLPLNSEKVRQNAKEEEATTKKLVNGAKFKFEVEQIVAHLNEKAGTGYRPSSKKTQSLIRARMNEGFEVEDFKTVIRKKCMDWKGTDMEKHLVPNTLFGNKFENYFNQKINANERKKKSYEPRRLNHESLENIDKTFERAGVKLH